MQKLATVFLLALSLKAAIAAEPIAMVPRTDPAVVQMEDVYRRYRKAAKAADVDAFRAVMSERANAALVRINPQMLEVFTRDDLDPDSATFGRADMRTSAARLIYSKEYDDHTRWQGVVFVKEKGSWRIDRVVAAIDPKNISAQTRLGVGKMGLEDLLAHPNMQLPSP